MKRFNKAAAVFLIASLSVFCFWGCSGGKTGETAGHSASAEAEGTKGLEFTLLDDGESYSVSAYNGWDEDVVIPSEYKGKPVTWINYGVLANREILESVRIPGTINTILDNCFYNCKNLKKVILDEGVEWIGSKAFDQCYNLESISLPSTIKDIDKYYFSYSTELKYNEYNRIKYLGNEQNPYLVLMNGKYAPSAAEIHPQTQIIADKAFENARNITQISIPGSINIIGEAAFKGCEKLTYAELADGAEKNIKWETFADCTHLKQIKIPKSVLIIGPEAFKGCENLTSVELADGIESIDWGAFAKCSNLKQIKIPKSVSYIEETAFSECTSLSDIQIDNNNQTYKSVTNCIINISDKSLIYGNHHSVIPNDGSIKSIGESAFYQCAGLREIILPDGLKSIGKEAFNSCKDLIKVSIPLSVESIGERAFDRCELIEYNNYNGDLYLGSEENPYMLFYKVGDIYDDFDISQEEDLMPFYKARDRYDGFYSLHEDTKIIGSNAFAHNSTIRSINIPAGVIEIGANAFAGCDNITNIELPDSLKYIGVSAFGNCYNLQSITVPGSVKELSQGVFSYCKALQEVTICEGAEHIETNAFYNCSELETVNIPLSMKSIDIAFFSCGKISAFNYNGTKEQWNSIEKEDGWDRHLDAYTVYCTDGSIFSD